MDADRSRQLAEFVEYANTLDGDEKGEAQVFLDRLLASLCSEENGPACARPLHGS